MICMKRILFSICTLLIIFCSIRGNVQTGQGYTKTDLKKLSNGLKATGQAFIMGSSFISFTALKTIVPLRLPPMNGIGKIARTLQGQSLPGMKGPTILAIASAG
jgi:hypothetical protein